MPQPDIYEPFREALTEKEQAKLDAAQGDAQKLEAHIAIALDRARVQLEDKPALPEGVEPSIRFPGVDPVGKYSIIDMKFAQRMDAVLSTLASRTEEVEKRGRDYLQKFTLNNGVLYPGYKDMQEAAQQHRLLTRASKLCPDPAGREELHRQARELETDPRVVKFDQLLQGIEHIAGVRQDPIPQEIAQYFNEELRFPLPETLAEEAKTVDNSRPEIEVNFQDLENKLLLQTMANPRNWNKPWNEVKELAENSLSLEPFSSGLSAYAAATTSRILDPLFQNVERDTQSAANRCDLIAIDGKTVREIMQEQFTASGRGGTFNDFFRQNAARMTNELVAAGLMAGKRVETFIPDKYGEVPKEPTQLRKTGYEPSPLKPEKFNFWTSFFSKRGFFKEKVARQEEYERIMAARERMRDSAQKSTVRVRLGRLQDAVNREAQYDVAKHRDLFFDEIMAEQGLKTVTTDEKGQTVTKYNWGEMNSRLKRRTEPKIDEAFLGFGRSEAADACICHLVAQGHKFQDILDPNKLQQERHEAARLYMEKAGKNDAEWLGRTYYQGHKALIGQFEELTGRVDLRNEIQRLAVLPLARGIIRCAFTSSQFLGKGTECYKGYALEAMKDAGNDLARANKLAHDMTASIASATDATSYLMGEVQTQLQLADPTKPINVPTASVNLGVSRAVLQQMRNGTSMIGKFPPRALLNEYNMAASQDASTLRAALAAASNDPDKRAALAMSAANGRLTDELRITDYKAKIDMDPRTGQPVLPGTNVVKYLRQGEKGAFSVETVKEPGLPVRTGTFEFHLGSTLSATEPRLEQNAPRQEGPKQEAPKKQPPQKTASKGGGLSR